ncbi:MAG: hypothetical protein REH79_00820 [Spiroplasma sp.]|nr:hypothetical protein [Spiroplasma sp.]
MFKRSKNNKLQSLKRKYQKLMQQGKKIFDKWDQESKPPKKLVIIQKKLRALRKEIENEKLDGELQFLAEHPEIYEFLPNELT